ncbi:MAG TPA: PP2C family protein-serine/threonine phosphatase [Phycisphaerae bacterium]|nr:PP2C family protein-serine/threonine phosphatase [Phycisphaerae bacterium]
MGKSTATTDDQNAGDGAGTGAPAGMGGGVEGQGPRELVCSEVWGGNRFVETEVKLPGMTGWVYSRPCGGPRGGDVHYLSTCSAGLMTRACLADVVGHGEQVAQMSGWIHRLLGKHMNNPDPNLVLEALNRQAVDAGFEAMTTAALICYYAPRGLLRYGYAGHPRALHYRAVADEWQPLAEGDDSDLDGSEERGGRQANIPLGVQKDVGFDLGMSTLEEGDRVVIFSDGVLETPRPDGALFSTDRLVEVLRTHGRSSAKELGRALVEALYEFAGSRKLTHDDVSFIILDAGPRPRGPAIWHLVRNQTRRLIRKLRG